MSSKIWKKRALELAITTKMSWRKIALELGVPKSTVSDYLRSQVGSKKPEVVTEKEDIIEESALEELCKSPEVHTASLAKRLRNAQRANSQLRKIQNKVFDQDVHFKEHLSAVEKAVSSLNKNQSVFVVPDKIVNNNKLTKATVEILFSDLQIGKVGEKYNTEKAIKALKEYGENLVQYIKTQATQYSIERIIFASLGDIVEDHLKHGVQSAVSTDSGLSEQMANAITYLWKYVLYPVFSLGIPVDVMCIAGNHGSSQHKGMDMYKAGLYSYDYTIYKTLELLSEAHGFKYVDFIIPEGVFGYLNIYGNYAVYEHGYFQAGTEKAMGDQMKKRGQQIKKHVEYFRCGDMHHTCSYDSHRLILNGAFFGVDEGGTEYSGILGFNSVPSQVVVLHTPEERLGRTTAKDFHLIQLA